MENYFSDYSLNKSKTSLLIDERFRRTRLSTRFNILSITTGDVIAVVFWKEAIIYRFEGICFSIKKRSLLCADVVLVLRNVITGVSIELLVSYYYNRIYFLVILDYKRKYFLYRKSKLYYIRHKMNQASKIKS